MTPEIHIDDDFFYGQFILSRTDSDKLKSWKKIVFNGWFLKVHPLLKIHKIKIADDTTIGWLIGHVISPEGELYTNDRLIFYQEWDQTDHSGIEDFIYKFSGRFIFLSNIPGFERIYLDPAGSLAMVYSGDDIIVASTLSLIRWFKNENLVDENAPLGILKPNEFYPAGLTADDAICRLLPNHYLDLETFTPHRHWPKSGFRDSGYKQVPELVKIISEAIRSNLRAVVDKYTTFIGITSGRDTRMLLACGRKIADKITFFSFDSKTLDSNFDQDISIAMAGKFGLNHLILPISEPEDRLKLEYQVRTGYAGNWGKVKDFYIACKDHLDLKGALMTGFSGEVGRSYYLTNYNYSIHPSRPDLMLYYLNLPSENRSFQDAMLRWYEEVKDYEPSLKLDLYYIENRLGCWAFPHIYGAAPFKVNLIPFCSRIIYGNMMRLKTSYRVKQRLTQDIAALYWPELLEFPFNLKKTGSSPKSKIYTTIKSFIKKGF